MERFIKGDIVIIPFPFSDLSDTKRRPALGIANLASDDIILCQITSKNYQDPFSIGIEDKHFTEGSLPVPSMIRPNKLFTADKHIIIRKAGHLIPNKIEETNSALKIIFGLH